MVTDLAAELCLGKPGPSAKLAKQLAELLLAGVLYPYVHGNSRQAGGSSLSKLPDSSPDHSTADRKSYILVR